MVKNSTHTKTSAAVPGALNILSASAVMMTVPGSIWAPPTGPVVTALVVSIVLVSRMLPAPIRRPSAISAIGKAWISGTSALEGITALGGLAVLPPMGLVRWWFPVLLAAMAVHLSTFTVWMRRVVDVLLVPVAWVAVAVAVGSVYVGELQNGWVLSGWLMSTAVTGYVIALSTPAGNMLCGPASKWQTRTVEN